MEQMILNMQFLERKIIPNKKEDVIIKFGNVSTRNEEIPNKIPEIKFTDKRKNSNINRDLILNKLNQNNLLLVKQKNVAKSAHIEELSIEPIVENVSMNVETSKPEKTIKLKKKKIILKNVEPIKEPEQEIELGTEPEPEKQQEMEPETESETDFDTQTEIINIINDLEKTKKGKKSKKGKTEQQPEPETNIDLSTSIINNKNVKDIIPKEKEKIIIKAPSYYMNNRRIFIQKLTDLFTPYRKEVTSKKNQVSCDDIQNSNNEFDLLTHQKIVRDYLNLYTPYRGLLLYHGLGSGKTCTSIAIAEGMKSNKKVYVLTPASLKMNFFSEMKKCGDELYKKNQYWEFVSITGNPGYIGILSRSLSLPVDFIQKNKGAWFVDITKQSNYTELSSEQQKMLDDQLNEMIRSKYIDINYNGLNMKKIDALTENKTINPFDDSVILIDEAHNFVSRIVNKLKQPNSISYILYDNLMKASNAKIILLTGTPIINYPYEIGILFNILRGYIKTWTMTLKITTTEKINRDEILAMFDKANLKTYDYVEYTGDKLTITRNPFGFINTKKRGVLKGTHRTTKKGGNKKSRKITKKEQKNKSKKNSQNQRIAEELSYENEEELKNEVEPELSNGQAYNDPEFINNNPYKGGNSDIFERYDGVHLDETGNMSDNDFIQTVLSILKKNNIDIPNNSIELKYNKSLPDNSETFINTFIDEESDQSKNINLFKKRILGLTSYFRSAQEELLPELIKTSQGENYHIVKSDMSIEQFLTYEKIRKVEAEREKQTKKMKKKQNSNELFKISSTYRIFSRASCNFVFPDTIERPQPNISDNEEIDETDFDNIPKNQRTDVDIYNQEFAEENDENNDTEVLSYSKRIEKALEDVNVKIEGTNKSKYLDKSVLNNISPKFLKILENITDIDNKGLHLLYSHFRTIEGIGILRLILLANGFAEFKIHKKDTEWEIIEDEEYEGKPRFVLYTGTETAEEKEIIRNIYNGLWDYVPVSISSVLKQKHENNLYGELIKLMMITSSGAEGINLKNTRFVHIVEPYWHMVRIDQVVGRARRICSHQDLPEELRNVKVFLYITKLSDLQKVDEKNIELRIRDVSRIDRKTPVTTDETLYEISLIKKRINDQILKAVKETAVDCNIYSSVSSKSNDEQLVCYGFGKVESNDFTSYPSFDKDKENKESTDVKMVKLKAIEVTINGMKYAFNQQTNELYDLESYNFALKTGSQPIIIGTLVKEKGEYKIVKK
jgi:hypothetical protein